MLQDTPFTATLLVIGDIHTTLQHGCGRITFVIVVGYQLLPLEFVRRPRLDSICLIAS